MLYFDDIIKYLPVVQSLFFIFLFFVLYKDTSSAKYILMFMLTSFFGFLLERISFYHYYPVSVFSYYFTLPFLLSMMPFLYLYVYSLTEINFRFKKKYFLHFVPAIIILIINIITFNNIPYESRIKFVEADFPMEIHSSIYLYINVYNFSQIIIYNIQLILYSFFLIKRVIINRKKIENFFSNPEKYRLKWLNVLIFIIAIYSIYDIVIFFSGFKADYPWIYYTVTFTYISIIGYGAAWQKEIYNKVVPTIAEQKNKSTEICNENDKTEFEDDTIKEIANSIKELVEKEELFLNHNLTIDNIANKLGFHRNIISKAINNYYKKNFHQFINDYRIDYAIKLLENKKFDNITIEGIAINSGFNSKSVFNPAFKAKMNITPSQYRKKYL